jgi:hypothetical protein
MIARKGLAVCFSTHAGDTVKKTDTTLLALVIWERTIEQWNVSEPTTMGEFVCYRRDHRHAP